jgi:hypothetical protein
MRRSRQSVLHREDRRQFLVFDLDQFGRPLGRGRVARDHRRHLLSHEPDLVLSENVAVVHVQAEAEGKILPSDDLDHAGQPLRPGGIDMLDQGVGVGALHDRGV